MISILRCLVCFGKRILENLTPLITLFGGRLGVVLGSFWDRFGIVLGPVWDRFGVGFGVILG